MVTKLFAKYCCSYLLTEEIAERITYVCDPSLPCKMCRDFGIKYPEGTQIFQKQTSSTRASLLAQLVKNPPAMQETRFNSWVRKIHWRRNRLPSPVFLGFPCGSADKEATYNARDLGLIPVLKRSLGEGKGYPLQYSGLKATCSSILAWRIPWRSPWKSLWSHKQLDTTEQLSLSQFTIHFHFHFQCDICLH